ncbi:GlxA family transcriptional regulator [Cystobacter ferrugineus]|uniref:AraC family transcriptional regulator n=1 Tax=Cystobacter ferrugineus TaxID=83449 RepID=A0A1L9BB39_9BACT|nr:GlxA family transcriptional regulator [Cystobacter ferrugineus]OJH39484.1 AraC family transcriptional regulator [Cystobacter ferrugineus]
MSRVTILVYKGFQVLDATGPAAAFEIAGHFGAPYSIRLASLEGGRVASSSGIAVETVPLAEALQCELLLIPGADNPLRAARQKELLTAIADAARSGRRVASVCSGAFILAAAGLLEGRRAATHWAAVEALKRLHPRTVVDAESIFVEDRGVWTSAGVVAGIDLALALIGRDHGDELARKVAQKMVVYHRRPGTQPQHSALLDMVTPDNRFAPLLAWARARLSEPLSVERLAKEAALSVRQFTRAFTQATGVAPAKAIERLRVEAARAAIEAGADSLEEVARRTGFGNGDRMRRAFVRITGQPPLVARTGARREPGMRG